MAHNKPVSTIISDVQLINGTLYCVDKIGRKRKAVKCYCKVCDIYLGYSTGRTNTCRPCESAKYRKKRKLSNSYAYSEVVTRQCLPPFIARQTG